MADVLPQRISPLHRRHLSLGAQMTSENGWQRPARYASAQEEAAAVQSGAGLCDITPVSVNYCCRVPTLRPRCGPPSPV